MKYLDSLRKPFSVNSGRAKLEQEQKLQEVGGWWGNAASLSKQDPLNMLLTRLGGSYWKRSANSNHYSMACIAAWSL